MTLRDKMLAVIDDVNGELAEREELVELISIALLTRRNLFILGDSGQAKSFAINHFRQRITDAQQFERLLSKQSDEEQLFGRIDLSSMIPGAVPASALVGDRVYEKLRLELERQLNAFPLENGTAEVFERLANATNNLNVYRSAVAALRGSEPTVLTSGKIPETDICFLDECFKCNDGVLNSLLTALNERKYTNEGRTYPIPTISFFTASNEIPNFNDPQEKILSALYDRLDLKEITENIKDRDNRLAVLKKKQSGAAGQINATITLDELIAMQKEVAAIPVPDAINELADDILCELRRNGVVVSDRRYLGYYPIAQAKAWLMGHSEVQTQDLLSLRCYLWQRPSELPQVDAVLNRLCVNPMQDKVSDLRAMASEIIDELENAGEDVDARKAFRKFRTELVRVYGMYQELFGKVESDNELAMLDELLADLEKESQAAHEKHGYTYATLAELAELQ